MGKVTETKKGKPVEKYRVKCAICSLTQDVRPATDPLHGGAHKGAGGSGWSAPREGRVLVNAQCERCGADLAPPKTG